MPKRHLFLFALLFLALSAGVLHSRAVSQAIGSAEGANYLSYLPIVARPYEPQWLGPDGGSIVCLAISPSNPNIMYAGTWGAGVHRSTDGGITWKQVNQGLPSLNINALAVDPLDPNVVYAGPYRYQLYKSINGGQSWFAISSGIQAQAIVYSIAIDPFNPNRLYAATRGISNNGAPPWNGRVYRSTDGGASWSESLVNVGGALQQDWAYSLAINPANPNEIFAAMHEYGVYKSVNAGASWVASNGIGDGVITDLSGRSIAFNRQDTRWLFLGVWHGDTVFITDNSGTKWARYNKDVNSNPITPAVYNLAVDPLNPYNVYLATWDYNGVLKSFDSTYRWRSAGLAQDQIYTVAVKPDDPAVVFAGTYGDGLYRSANYAASWAHSQAGITNTSVRDLVVMPDGSIYAAIDNGGVSRLLAQGQPWQDFMTGLPDKKIHDLARSPSKPNRIFAATNSAGLYYADIGETSGWVRVPLDLPTSSLSVDLFDANHPFADRQDLEAETDPSLQFDMFMPLAAEVNAPVLTMTFAPSNANIAYLGVAAGNTPNAAIYRSTNGGMTWAPTKLYNRNVWALAVSPQNSNLVYAASASSGTIFVSTDGGSSWSETYLPPWGIYSLAISASDPNRVYAGTNDGVYVRVGGGNWTRLGLTGISVPVLAADPVKPNTLYAGTNRGVYVSFDAGLNWSDAQPYLPNDTIQAIAFDPSDPHYVYFGTLVRGTAKFFYP